MAEFHNTKRVAIINKAGAGKSTLARFLIESELLSEKGWWITDIWTNAEIYSGNMFTGEVDLKDGSIFKGDIFNFPRDAERIWNPLRYKTRERPNGVNLHVITHLKQLEQANTGIQYLDEMLKCLPARRSGSEYNLIYGSMMSNIRKVECHFIGTDQYRKGGDVFIRTNIGQLLVPIAPPEDGKKPLEYWVYDDITDANFDFLKNPPNPFENALLKTCPVNCTGGCKFCIPAKQLWALFKTKDILPLSYDVPFGVKEYTEVMNDWRLPSGELFGEKIGEFTIKSPELGYYLNLYEQLEKKHMTEGQRKALRAYLDTMGLLKKWEKRK